MPFSNLLFDILLLYTTLNVMINYERRHKYE
nr:MAG TPA: hypothetical protein [Bacteriophage sp.]